MPCKRITTDASSNIKLIVAKNYIAGSKSYANKLYRIISETILKIKCWDSSKRKEGEIFDCFASSLKM